MTQDQWAWRDLQAKSRRFLIWATKSYQSARHLEVLQIWLQDPAVTKSLNKQSPCPTFLFLSLADTHSRRQRGTIQQHGVYSIRAEVPCPTLPTTFRLSPILQMLRLRPETHSISFPQTQRQESHKRMPFQSLVQLITRWGIASLGWRSRVTIFFLFFFSRSCDFLIEVGLCTGIGFFN